MPCCLENSDEDGGKGRMGTDHQAESDGPLPHHQDVPEEWGGSKNLIQVLRGLDANRAASVANGLAIARDIL